MGLDTKEKRLEARKFFYSEGMEITDMPEIELTAYMGNDPLVLCIFKGSAAKPFHYYSYRTIERRDAELQKAIEAQKRSLEYKAQCKAENKGNLTGSAATAKAIKARLKAEFPGVKFSVTSDNFSMGNSVSISWTDGPLYEQVDGITRQYQYGHFDGMTDSYEYRDIKPELDCPGAKYVHCNRKLSPEYKAQLQEVLERDFTPYHGPGHYAPFQYAEAEKIMLGIAQEPENSVDPISSVEPESLVAGQNTHPSVGNVIDITARLRAKREQEEVDKALSKFKTEYLPNFTAEEVASIMIAEPEKKMDIVMTACMRVDLEKSRG